MMNKPYDVVFSQNSLEDLEKLLPRVAQKVLRHLTQLEGVQNLEQRAKKLDDTSLGEYKLYAGPCDVYFDLSSCRSIVVLQIREVRKIVRFRL